MRATDNSAAQFDQGGKIVSAEPLFDRGLLFQPNSPRFVKRGKRFKNGSNFRSHGMRCKVISCCNRGFERSPCAAENSKERTFLGPRQFQRSGGVCRIERVVPSGSILCGSRFGSFEFGERSHVPLQCLRLGRERVEQARRIGQAGGDHLLCERRNRAGIGERRLPGKGDRRVVQQFIEPLDLALGGRNCGFHRSIRPILPDHVATQPCEGMVGNARRPDDFMKRAEHPVRHLAVCIPQREVG